MQLIRPQGTHLESYVAALRRGWSADTLRGAEAAREELDRIDADAAAFIDGHDDPLAKGPPVTLPDGTVVPRLPSIRRWMWDGEFAGSINLRWQHGTNELPAHVLGHIGYAVVPWKQRRGHATAALRLMLGEARSVAGLDLVVVTTDAENIASQRVIESAGGGIPERFVKPPQYGGKPALRYRIALE